MKKIKVDEALIARKSDLNEKIYLSDLKEFQGENLSVLYNTVFNKVVTGIGGTTLALKSNENIIILMPFVEVVNNKEGVVEDSFVVKAGVTITAIVKYLKSVKIRKIVSTYDGLEKIVKAYTKAGINIYNDFLLIDEWQVLFQQYGLRHDIIKYLFKESLLFTNKCFMTATPIKKDYWFKEFNNLTELVLDYDVPSVKLKHYRALNVIDETIAIIKNSVKYNYNLHFFINSVDSIKSIVKTLNIPQEDVRIICSKQDKNESKLVGYKIENTKDPVKKFNFYTSTCFEGCDLLDENGKIFVLCDGAKAHTLVDISTQLHQIAGRIRNIKDTSVNLIYKTTRYIDVTEEEFNRSINENIRIGNEIVEGVVNEEAMKALDLNYINSKYITFEDNKLHFEEVFLNADKANFEISKTYSCKANISAKLVQNFEVVEVKKEWEEEITKYQEEKVDKLSFREQCLMYANLTECEFSFIPKFNDDVIKSVDKLGIDRLEELNFHKGHIKEQLIKLLDISDEQKIFKAINLNKFDFYKASDLKAKFQTVYNHLGIKKTAKGSDIKNYYNVKEVSKRIGNEVFKGFQILSEKIIIK